MASAPTLPPPPLKQSPLKTVGAFPARTQPPPVAAQDAPAREFGITRGVQRQAHRIGIYGPACVGKTSLVASIPNSVIIDLEDGSIDLNVTRVPAKEMSWAELRQLIQGPSLDSFSTICIDTGTRAEAMGKEWTLANVMNEKGYAVKSVEGYGYGKGYVHLYETFICLLADLDRHFRAGRNVVIIFHDVTAKVPNPEGDDYIRWEPRIQNEGKGDLRRAVTEWLDHLFFVNFDKNVDKDGKVSGCGSRTIYPTPMPHFIAKSRTLKDAIPYIENDATLWNQLFKQGA